MRIKVSSFFILASFLLTCGTIYATPIVYGVTFNTDGQAGFIDIATGAFTVVGTVGSSNFINDVAFAPNGTLYAISNTDELVTINIWNGAVTAVMPVPGLETLVFTPSGVLYAASQSALYTIDLTAHTTTEIGPYGTLGNAQNIRFDASGNLYTTDTGTPTNVFLVNTSTGQATYEFNVPFGAVSLGEADGRLYGVGISGIGGALNLVWVDPATHTGTQTLSSFPSVDFSEPFSGGFVPEPGALSLCGLGLAALVFRSRKRA